MKGGRPLGVSQILVCTFLRTGPLNSVTEQVYCAGAVDDGEGAAAGGDRPAREPLLLDLPHRARTPRPHVCRILQTQPRSSCAPRCPVLLSSAAWVHVGLLSCYPTAFAAAPLIIPGCCSEEIGPTTESMVDLSPHLDFCELARGHGAVRASRAETEADLAEQLELAMAGPADGPWLIECVFDAAGAKL
eukprot:COSAG01_NODE_1252_length_11052_cov_503.195380_5_plen_189_part_00